MSSAEKNNWGVDKVALFGWKLKDVPGQQAEISKHQLKIHPAYQRQFNNNKACDIANAWSWIECGVLVVARRGGEYWVVDGQHRLGAAIKRSDIQKLPCLVFDTDSVQQEAKAFLGINVIRRTVSATDKFRAKVVAEDPAAVLVRDMCEEYGVEICAQAKGPRQTKSIAFLTSIAEQDPEALRALLQVAVEICEYAPISAVLLNGLHYIHRNVEGGLLDARLRERIVQVGGERLTKVGNLNALGNEKGGAKVYSEGMLAEINKGLRRKFTFKAGR